MPFMYRCDIQNMWGGVASPYQQGVLPWEFYYGLPSKQRICTCFGGWALAFHTKLGSNGEKEPLNCGNPYNNNNKAFQSQASWGRLELKPNRKVQARGQLFSNHSNSRLSLWIYSIILRLLLLPISMLILALSCLSSHQAISSSLTILLTISLHISNFTL